METIKKALRDWVEEERANWQPRTETFTGYGANHGSATGEPVTIISYYDELKHDFVTSKEQAFQSYMINKLKKLIDMPREVVITTEDKGEVRYGFSSTFITAISSVFIYLFVWALLYGTFYIGNRLKHISEWAADAATGFALAGFVMAAVAVVGFITWRHSTNILKKG